MRHKQPTPKRKRTQACDWGSTEAAGGHDDGTRQDQQQPQQQHTGYLPQPQHAVPPDVPLPQKHVEVDEINVPTCLQHTGLGALAEYVVATKAAGTTPGAAPTELCMQLFEKPHQHVYYVTAKKVLLLSWRCPGEDVWGPKHEVCIELPLRDADSILALLKQGHLSFSIQQLPHQQSTSSTSGRQPAAQQQLPCLQQQQQQPGWEDAVQLLRPVQYTTLTANSDYVQEFECDVVMLPEQPAVQAGVERCCMLAAAAATVMGGTTASLAQQSHALLEVVAPRLPAQHVSLMAAATAPELLQEQAPGQAQERQEQAAAVDAAGGAVSGAADGGKDPPSAAAAAAALTLWRVRLCLSEAAVSGAGGASTEQQIDAQLGIAPAALQAAISWLVPHWSCNASQNQHSAAGFDAAQVYRVTKPSGFEAQLQGHPSGLKPQLRPYQRRAVAWMLGLEMGQHATPACAAESGAGPCSSSTQQLLAGLLQPYSEWQSVLLLPALPSTQPEASSGSCSSRSASTAATGTASGRGSSVGSSGCDALDSSGEAAASGGDVGDPYALRKLFFHPLWVQLATEAPQQPPAVPGGILADEMGLGKTVELLSIIMSNRFQPAGTEQQAEHQQEQLHKGPLLVNQSGPQLSACSSSGSSADGKCCARCGESFEARYTKGGKITQYTRSDMLAEDDSDGYVPRTSQRKGKGSKQQPARGTKRSAKTQQLPPLPPHGAGHHGGKRQRLGDQQLQDQGRSDSCGAEDSAGGDLLCSLCMREMALQEVDQDCGTTLIVVPANILVQWVDELQRHTLPGSLSIKVYSGQPQASTPAATASSRSSRSRSSSPSSRDNNVRGAAAATAAGGKAAASNEVVTAAQLAAADIVLTTYDIIRKEVALQPQTEGVPERNLRHRKRYAVVPTPLSRLVFWRLVMDEAQLTGGTSKAAEMAQHIRARHRWAITGTPISHGGRADLLGLLKFLQVPHIPQGVGRLLRLLCPVTGGLMWRTAKADVLVEMGIPPQHHHTTVLRLSAIERHWYNRSHQECAAKARKVLQDALELYILNRDFPNGRRSGGSAAVEAAKAAAKRAAAAAIAAGGDGRQLDEASAALLDLQLASAQLKKLLLPLLRLRQACCHPQVGASGIRAIISGNNSSKPLTMDQILGVLIARARVEAEEAQRQLAGALNGLAALLWLARRHPDAVAAYREVLALSEASKGEVRLDRFQLLHTLHNLAELLQELARKQQHARPQQQQQLPSSTAAEADANVSADKEPYGPNVPRTLRDEKLAAEATAIREQYLAQRQAELATAHGTFAKAAADALPAGLRKHKQQQQQAAGAAGSSHGSKQQAGLLDDVMLLENGDMEAEDDGLADADGALAAGDDVSEGSGCSGWFIRVIDALKEAGADEEVAEAIREKLQEGDTYLRQVSKNATTMANRFKTLGGLKLLLSQELTAINRHQAACLTALQELQGAVGGASEPDELLIEQAGQCGRCRGGAVGRVCQHCKLDEDMRTWEARLFQLQTKALAAGTQLDVTDAARQAQAAAIRRVVGRGGLNEQATEDMIADADATAAAAAAGGFGGVVGPSAGAGARRSDAAVSEAQVVRHPSEAERVLRLLQQQISKLGMASYLPGVQEAASQHLEQLEGSRKLFVAANSLSISQRQLLYAHDELTMAVLRITTRRDNEQVTPHEALYKLTSAEQVLKKDELSLEKAVAAGELRRSLGTLNYLKTIAGARTRVAAAAVTAAAAGGDDGSKPAGHAATQQQQPQPQQQPQQQQQQQKELAQPKPADPRIAAAAAALRRAHASRAPATDDTPSQQQQQQHKQPGGQSLPDQQLSEQQGAAGPSAQAADAEAAAAAAAAAAATGGNEAAAGPSTQTPSGTAAGDAPAAPAAPEDRCPICFGPVDVAAAVLPCGHVLCCCCADALVERIPAGTAAAHRHINCPSCRAHTHVSDVAYVTGEQSSKHAYVHTSSTMAAAGAVSASATTALDSTAAATAAAEYPFKGEQQLVLAGSYGTKIEAVVRRVLFVLQQDPASKVLVFSSWADVLSIVSHALEDNGVLHAFAKDRKGLLQALEKFKGAQVSAAELGDAATAAGQAEQGAAAASSKSSSSTRMALSTGSSRQQQEEAEEEEEQQLRGLDCMDMEEDDSSDAAADGRLRGQGNRAASGAAAEADGSGLNASNSAARPPAGAAGTSSSAEGSAGVAGPCVLLLLVSQGGLGLNLTEAQHVVLLEPLLDPALDVQAIGRVSRFGQTRATHVHRFIVQDTVEENVARLSCERAAAMDMTAAVPVKGGAAETAQLTVQEVATLVCSKWRDGRDA